MLKPFILSILAASLSLAGLTGCATVGHEFSAPASIKTPEYRHLSKQLKPSEHLPAQWWNVFADPALDALEMRALSNNPGIQASAQRLIQAQAQLVTLRSAQLPSVNLNTGISNARTSSNSSQGIAFGRRAIEGNNYAVGAAMSYEIDLWGRVKHIVEAAQAQSTVAENEHQQILLLLSTQIASTYWQLRGMDAEMAILQHALKSRLETEQLIQARLNAGLSNELDLSRAQIERANAQADLHEVKRQRNLLEHSLASLTGVSATDSTFAQLSNAELPQAPLIPAGLPASLLAQRPDLAASIASLRALNAQIGVAEGSFYPSVTLTLIWLCIRKFT